MPLYSFFNRPVVAPEDLLITDRDTWSALTPDQQKAYVGEIERARLACRANRSFTVNGNINFIIGATVGGLLSSLTPNHWSLNKRSTPFFALGMIGLVVDWFLVTQRCQLEYPLPQGFSQVTGRAIAPDTPENPLMPSSTSTQYRQRHEPQPQLSASSQQQRPAPT